MDKALDDIRDKWLTLARLRTIAISILAIWLVYALAATGLSLASGENGLTKGGLFGDMFGALNALFSGLAFAGVIITILLQSKELGLQREELKAQREEMHRFADAQEKSEEALSKQAESMEIAAKLNVLSADIQAQSSFFVAPGDNKMPKRLLAVIAEARELAGLATQPSRGTSTKLYTDE